MICATQNLSKNDAHKPTTQNLSYEEDDKDWYK